MPAIQLLCAFWVSLFVGRLVSYGERISPRQDPKLDRTERGLLQLMAHRPIAIDGAGGVEPGPSNEHGGCGACIDQVVVPTAPPRPSARDKHAVRRCVVNEHRLPMPLKSQQWVWKHFTVCAKEEIVNIAVSILYVCTWYVCRLISSCSLVSLCVCFVWLFPEVFFLFRVIGACPSVTTNSILAMS